MLRIHRIFFIILLPVGLLACLRVNRAEAPQVDEAAALAAARQKHYQAISLDGFEDCIRHYRALATDLNYPRYPPDQIVDIAENLLLFQDANGGWPKNMDWLKIEKPEQAAAEVAHLDSHGTTFDNHNIHTQAVYLARVHLATGLDRYKRACDRAIDYMLHEQRASGGWCGADVDAITFNDDVMTGVLGVLRDYANGKDPFTWADPARRERARAAVDRGTECILDCQIRFEGRLTAWCQQHDHATLAPVGARTYELPSICSRESVGVVEYLMGIEHPNARVIASIQGAVAWMNAVQIHGVRLVQKPITPWRFDGRPVTRDVTTVADPAAGPLWARYYDLKHDEPLFVRRGGVIVKTFNEIQQERRQGYQWYGTWPADLLQREYPAWQRRWAPQQNVLAANPAPVGISGS